MFLFKNKSVERYDNQNAVWQYYSMQYAPYLLNAYEGEDTESFYKEINSVIKKYLPPQANVLEIGCGLGRVLLNIQNLPIKKSVGIDISKTFIDECNLIKSNRSKWINYNSGADLNNLEFQIGDAQNLNFRDNEFDLVICLNVIDRVPNPRQVIKEIERVIKANGILIISDPYDWQDKFTPPENQIKNMHDLLPNSKWTILEEDNNLPFIIRQNPRKTVNYSNHLLVLRRK